MKHIDRIQKYLDGNMSDEELVIFRNDLQKDPELVQELDLHRSLGEVIVSRDEERFRKKLDEAYKNYKILSAGDNEPETLKSQKRVLKYFTFIVPVLLLFALFFYLQGNRKYSNEKIFNTYLSSFSNELNSRIQNDVITEINVLEKGEKFFLQSDYSEASRVFLGFLKNNPGSIEAHFYNGLCYIYLNEFKNAIASFEFVIHQPYNYYQEYANWYLTLCYIRTNQNATARNLLKDIEKGNGFFSSKAKKIERRLK